MSPCEVINREKGKPLSHLTETPSHRDMSGRRCLLCGRTLK